MTKRRDHMKTSDILIPIIRNHFPGVQGIYLFGSQIEGSVRPDSDLDIALLLSHEQAKQTKSLAGDNCRFELENAFHPSGQLCQRPAGFYGTAKGNYFLRSYLLRESPCRG